MSTGKKKRKKLDTLSYILYFRYLDDNLYNEMGKKRAMYSSLHFLTFKCKKKFTILNGVTLNYCARVTIVNKILNLFIICSAHLDF